MANDVANLVIKVTSDSVKKGEKALKKLTKQGKKTEKQSTKMAKGFKLSGKAIAGIAIAVATAIAAYIKLTREMSKLVREQKISADLAGTTVEKFKALAYAAKTVNVDMMGLADAFNDVKERIGEYTVAGTGAFQDVADALSLTRIQAIQYAKELSKLDSVDQLNRLSKDLHEAGISGGQLTFVLKSLSNDFRLLEPLLENNNEKMNTLTKEYDDMAKAFGNTTEDLRNLEEVGLAFDKIGESISQASTAVAALFSKELAALIRSIDKSFVSISSSSIRLAQSMREILNLDAKVILQREVAGYRKAANEAIAIAENIENKIRKGSYHPSENRAKKARADAFRQRAKDLKFQAKQASQGIDIINEENKAKDAAYNNENKKNGSPKETLEVGLVNEKELAANKASLKSQRKFEYDRAKQIRTIRATLNGDLEELEKIGVQNIVDGVHDATDAQIEALRKRYDYVRSAKEQMALEDQETLSAAETKRLEFLKNNTEKFYEEKSALEAQGQELLRVKAQVAADEMVAIEVEKNRMIFQSGASTFDALASAAESYKGKQSSIYRGLFAASKGFAAAEAVIKLQQGLAASASIGYPANIVAVGGFLASTAGILSSINSANYSGRMNGGDMNSGQPYVVGERGPELVVPRGAASVIPRVPETKEQSTNNSQEVTIINQLDEGVYGGFLDSEQGQKVLINAIGENKEQIKTIVNN